MTPRQLETFVAVARVLSFARASESLYMSQPALSLAIRNLEEELGGPLFSRTTRHVRLTPEGSALLPLAVQLLADFSNVKERLSQRFKLQKGHLTIAAMPSFCASVFPPILAVYRKNYPGIDVSIHDVLNENVIGMVQEGRVELGICFEPIGERGLFFEPLFEDRFVAIVSRDSRLASKNAISWNQLLHQEFITLQRPSSLRRLLEKLVSEAGIEFQVAFDCHQLATVVRMVAAGLGVSAVPSMLRDQLELSGVHSLKLNAPMVSSSVGIITRRDHQLSIAASAMQSEILALTKA